MSNYGSSQLRQRDQLENTTLNYGTLGFTRSDSSRGCHCCLAYYYFPVDATTRNCEIFIGLEETHQRSLDFPSQAGR